MGTHSAIVGCFFLIRLPDCLLRIFSSENFHTANEHKLEFRGRDSRVSWNELCLHNKFYWQTFAIFLRGTYASEMNSKVTFNWNKRNRTCESTNRKKSAKPNSLSFRRVSASWYHLTVSHCVTTCSRALIRQSRVTNVLFYDITSSVEASNAWQSREL